MPGFETMDIEEFERAYAVGGRGGVRSRYLLFLGELEDGTPTQFPLIVTSRGVDEAIDSTMVRNRRSQLTTHVRKLLQETHYQRWANFRTIVRQSRDDDVREELWVMIPFRGDVEFEGAWDHTHAREIAEEVTQATHAPQAEQFKES